MEWHWFLLDFLAGAFFANSVPHYVNGISGNRFPTVFSKPRGIGLSGPVTNVLWAMVNMNIGYSLAKHGHLASGHSALVWTMFAGVALTGVLLGRRFQHKHKDGQDSAITTNS